MGVNESKYEEDQERTTKIFKTVDKIVNKYAMYHDYDCNNVAVVYYKNMLNIPDSDILTEGSAIGLIHPDNDTISKQAICSKIVNFYRERIELLIDIKKVIILGQQAVLSFDNGNICINGYMEDCDNEDNMCISDRIILGEKEKCLGYDINGKNIEQHVPGIWIDNETYKEIYLKDENFNWYNRQIQKEKNILISKLSEYNELLEQQVNTIKTKFFFKNDKTRFKHDDIEFKKFKNSLSQKIKEIRTVILYHKYTVDDLINKYITKKQKKISNAMDDTLQIK